MAKLYWRIKKNGKWTWTPVFPDGRPEDLTDFLHDIFEGPIGCETEEAVE